MTLLFLRLIALSQLFAAVAAAYLMGPLLDAGKVSVLVALVVTASATLNLVAGIDTLRGAARGYKASLLNHLLQIPTIVLPGFTFQYVGLVGILVTYNMYTATQPTSPVSGIGFYAQISPYFEISLGEASDIKRFGINLLALCIVVFLTNILRATKPKPKAIAANFEFPE